MYDITIDCVTYISYTYVSRSSN